MKGNASSGHWGGKNGLIAQDVVSQLQWLSFRSTLFSVWHYRGNQAVGIIIWQTCLINVACCSTTGCLRERRGARLEWWCHVGQLNCQKEAFSKRLNVTLVANTIICCPLWFHDLTSTCHPIRKQPVHIIADDYRERVSTGGKAVSGPLGDLLSAQVFPFLYCLACLSWFLTPQRFLWISTAGIHFFLCYSLLLQVRQNN